MGRVPASIASMTGSRVDSASKHIRPCRVGQDYICYWIGKTFDELRANKLVYAVQKDDFFIGCGKPMFGRTHSGYNSRKAYASGLGSLTGITEEVKQIIIFLSNVCETEGMYHALILVIKEMFQSGAFDDKTLEQIKGIPEFYFGGVALTVGHPHGNLGDTALSVLTGGMMTVRNGPFDMHAGDTVTWVWDFEVPYLKKSGSDFWVSRDEEVVDRLVEHFPATTTDRDEVKEFFQSIGEAAQDNSMDTSRPTKQRKIFYANQYNEKTGDPMQRNNSAIRNCLPVIICLPVNASYVHKKRAFGKCLSTCRPYEHTDIMICRQGI
eukprot:1204244-Rhodomonas_salina.4